MSNADLLLDGSKIAFYEDRIRAWERGERIAPITVDMALLPRKNCNYSCDYCYADHQANEGYKLEWPHLQRAIEDFAEIGVRGVSLVSDGESSHHPDFVRFIKYAKRCGLDVAVGSNGFTVDLTTACEILPELTYFRFNISAGEKARYAEIMGVKPGWFDRVCLNIENMVVAKEELGAECTVGMQMVLQPQYADQILPLARLAKRLQADYLVIKHCSDTEDGAIGVDYAGYAQLYPLLQEAEGLSDERTRIVVKWSKIGDKGQRSYQRCYGAPFHIQLSGSGLVAPCGMLFSDKFKDRFHIGNIAERGFKEIWLSDRYWEVMGLLASPAFDAQKMCGSLCIQHRHNTLLDQHRKGEIDLTKTILDPVPAHLSFI